MKTVVSYSILCRKALLLAGFFVFTSILCSSLAFASDSYTNTTKADGYPMKNVLIEDFTGSWCVNCPAVAKILSQLTQENKPIAIVGYHLNETGQTAYLFNMDSYNRSNYYGTIRAIPTVYVNGIKTKEQLGYISKTIDSVKQLSTPYDINLSVKHIRLKETLSDSFEISVKVNKTASHNDANNILYLTINQDNIQKKWYDIEDIDHAMRFIKPTSDGLAIDMGSNTEKTFKYNFSIPYSKLASMADLSFVAFIQDSTIVDGKKSNWVYQVDYIKLYNGSEAIDVDFTADRVEIPSIDSIRFYTNFVGSAESLKWNFEGGEPNTSTDLNPVVKYNNPGKYSVKLDVISKGTNHSYQREDLIDVLDVRHRISFSHGRAPRRFPIQFNLLSLADSCKWDFPGGEPAKSTKKDPIVRYMEEDTFAVVLNTFFKSKAGVEYNYKTIYSKLILINDKFASNECKPPLIENKVSIYSDRNGIFIVDTPQPWEKAEIYNSFGKKIFELRSNSFSLQNQPHGLYIIKIYSKFSTFATKFIW